MQTSLINLLTGAFFILSPLVLPAQKQDTLHIRPGSLNMQALREGTSRYLVYFKLGADAPRKETQFWTRTISKTTQNGQPVILINQEWEDKDSVVHTAKSVCDGVTFQPIEHQFWWRKRGETSVDFRAKTVSMNGTLLSDADTVKAARLTWAAFASAKDQYSLNWHLDLEVFSTLPFKEGQTYVIPYYDPGTSYPLQQVAYTVTGSGILTGYDEQNIDCWLLRHNGKNNEEVFWISKKTKEVLFLEQSFGNNKRYKVKLAHSK